MIAKPTWYPLKSMRKSSKISGDVELQFILVDPSHPDATPEQLLQKIHAIVAVEHAADYEDDELSRYTSLENDHDDEDEEDRRDDDIYDIEKDDEAQDPSKPENVEKKKKRLRMKKRQKKARAYEFTGDSECVGIVFLEVEKIQDLPPEKNGQSSSFQFLHELFIDSQEKLPGLVLIWTPLWWFLLVKRHTVRVSSVIT